MTNFDQKQWLVDAVAVANVLQKKLAGLDGKETFKAIKSVVDNNDLVFGIFQDSSEPNGVGFEVIKGLNLLREISASRKTKKVSTGSIPCISREQAIAAQNLWGDKTQ
jgi:hypothetical protein